MFFLLCFCMYLLQAAIFPPSLWKLDVQIQAKHSYSLGLQASRRSPADRQPLQKASQELAKLCSFPDVLSPKSLLNAGAGLVQAFGNVWRSGLLHQGGVWCCELCQHSVKLEAEAELEATLSSGKLQPRCVQLKWRWYYFTVGAFRLSVYEMFWTFGWYLLYRALIMVPKCLCWHSRHKKTH